MSGTLADNRRYIIGTRGRMMTLRRPTARTTPVQYTDVSLLAFTNQFRPEQVQSPVQQGDSRALILNDEIAAAAWPGPPKVNDVLLDATLNKAWSVMGSEPAFDGPALIGHELWIRGGNL